MRHGPREARLLGLWTAGCLAVLLLLGILWIGDLALQWPVFVVPLVWALVAARPRRAAVPPSVPDDRYPDRDDRYREDRYRDDRYREDRYRDDRYREDRYPATREAPTLPPPPPRPPVQPPPGRRSPEW